MPNTIRNASAEDLPILLDLMEDFHGESGRALDREWAKAAFLALLGNLPLGAIWIATSDGEAVGYVVLTVRFTMEFGGLDAFIDDLFVRPAFRRRGLAQSLLAELFSECDRRGVLAVHVEAGRDNDAALGLYRSRGLQPGTDGRLMLTALLGKGLSSDSR